jgi:hypothetical protein
MGGPLAGAAHARRGLIGRQALRGRWRIAAWGCTSCALIGDARAIAVRTPGGHRSSAGPGCIG